MTGSPCDRVERCAASAHVGLAPPDLQGTFLRAGPARPGGLVPVLTVVLKARRTDSGGKVGALHAVEIRDGQAVWYQRQESEADAGVFWHADQSSPCPKQASLCSTRGSWNPRSSAAV